MKICSQAHGFGTVLHGTAVPKYSLYGNFSGRDYICVNPLNLISGGYAILVWNPTKNRWDSHNTAERRRLRNGRKDPSGKTEYGGIYIAIERFKKSSAFVAEKPVSVHRRETVEERQELAAAGERVARERRRRWERENMGDAPRAKLPQTNTGFTRYAGSCYSQASIDGRGYNPARYEQTSGLGEFTGVDGIKARERTGYMQNFEQGQTTAGTASAECPYTRSAWEVKRDGMKTRFQDFHGNHGDEKPKAPANKYHDSFEMPLDKAAKATKKMMAERGYRV